MSFSFRRTKRVDDVIVDRLTGAFNRRQLDVDIAAGIDTSGRSTATLMVDVDRFETFDGRRGNVKGDQVLERVAWVIMATVRTTDVVYRHQPSTFCVLLPSTSDADAGIVAERIRSNVAKMPLLSEYGVTVTVGVAAGPSDDVRDAVDRATKALEDAVRRKTSRIVEPVAVPTGRPGPAPADAVGASLAPSAKTPLVRPELAPVEALHPARPSEVATERPDRRVGEATER